mmetsp:Transcript_30075/g.66624  ORF Transcript_30075/g.66624 Transcript_30075/m.66624 type:complete len:105 (-) Transcript_30075:144-458(-)
MHHFQTSSVLHIRCMKVPYPLSILLISLTASSAELRGACSASLPPPAAPASAPAGPPGAAPEPPGMLLSAFSFARASARCIQPLQAAALPAAGGLVGTAGVAAW